MPNNGPTPGGVSPGGFRSVGPLPDRPMPENPEIPEIPEFPDVPEAPKMPESRPRRSPERLRASILSDLESLFWSIFVVFRGFALLTALALLGSIFGSIFAVFRAALLKRVDSLRQGRPLRKCGRAILS